MGRRTSVPIRHKRALNQALLYAKSAPDRALIDARAIVRALRSALRMSQAQLARRSQVPQAHIARLESGAIDPQLSTLSRLFDAMFCELLVLPRPRRWPSDALAERQVLRPFEMKVWD